MKKLTEGGALAINSLNPGNLNAGLGSRLRDLEQHALVELSYEIAADLTGGLDAIRCPCDLEVLDVVAQARSSEAGGGVTVRKGTDNVSSTIALETDKAIARTVQIDDAYSSFTEGQHINVITENAGDRALITVAARRT